VEAVVFKIMEGPLGLGQMESLKLTKKHHQKLLPKTPIQ
jgi:hypothetical protein